MSYLALNKTITMNKVVISFWFRIPKESADALSAVGLFFDYRIFYGVIPLLVLGKQPTFDIYDVTRVQIGTYYIPPSVIDPIPSVPVPVYGYRVTGRSIPGPPTSIGISLTSDGTTATLDVHIQTTDRGTVTNVATVPVDWVPTYNTDGVAVGVDHYINEDISYTWTGAPDYLGNSNATSANDVFIGPKISLDTWHHLLLSWDLSSSSSHGVDILGIPASRCIDSFSLMWCALDDVNKNKTDLPARWVGIDDDNVNPNGHISNNTYRVAGMHCPPDYIAASSVNFDFKPDAQYIPANSSYATSTGRPDATETGQPNPLEPLQKIEIAELQIFTGVTLDTSVEANRRAFITSQTMPDGSKVKKPAPVEDAETLMGKKPEVLLHGAADWKQGKNTGSLGYKHDADGHIVVDPEGQFTPAGTINRYTPDPSLTVPPAGP